MITTLHNAAAVAGILLVTACASPMHKRKVRFGSDRASDTSLVYWTAEGGVIIRTKDKLCVAPPAQAVRQIDSKARSTAAGGEQFELSFESDIDHESQRLYEQTQALLFFQFTAYRLCEMYLNGAITKEEYVTGFKEVVALGNQLVNAEIQRATAEAERHRAEKQRLDLLLNR
jgi:hypothetical protein